MAMARALRARPLISHCKRAYNFFSVFFLGVKHGSSVFSSSYSSVGKIPCPPRGGRGGGGGAEAHGHRDLVMWLQEIPREEAGDGDTVRVAAEGGGGTMLLEAMHECIPAADTGTLDAAVARGEREAMEWLAAVGLKGSSVSFCWAIKNRDMELLVWLQEQGNRGEAGALYDMAVRGGDLAVIRQLAELGYRTQDMLVATRQELVWLAVKRDLVAVVVWLRGRGCKASSRSHATWLGPWPTAVRRWWSTGARTGTWRRWLSYRRRCYRRRWMSAF